jgi:tyrosyl-tRNA synthetase
MAKYGLRPQVVMTTPILEGTDARVQDGVIVGKKMSKSAGNTVGIQDSPIEMFRKIMLIDDDVIFRFFDLLSRRSNAEIDTLRRERRQGRNPREIKALFAREVVERFHLPADADRAALEFDRIYSDHAIPDDIRRVELTPTGPLAELAWALKQAGLAESTSDAWRKVQNGGVEVDGARATDPKMPLEPGKEYLVRVGSKDRKFARICVVQ